MHYNLDDNLNDLLLVQRGDTVVLRGTQFAVNSNYDADQVERLFFTAPKGTPTRCPYGLEFYTEAHVRASKGDTACFERRVFVDLINSDNFYVG